MRVLCPPLSWNSTLACLALVCVPVRSFRLALPQGRTSRFRALTGLSMTTTGTEHVVGESTAQGWKDAVLPFLPPERCRTSSPAQALERGEWFKLICGASFEDLPVIRNLALIYTLAGADCIDVAAEGAVIEAARDGILAAQGVAKAIGAPVRRPWLMMSVNDDEKDPHFRKAVFDPSFCPSDCPRPCESICPADAVVFPDSAPPPAQRAHMVTDLLDSSPGGGVLEPRCYGCGRCIDVCPPGIIHAETYMRSPQNVRSLLEKVDAVEIHTKGDLARFRSVWEESVAEAAAQSLRLVAVSFPDLGINTGLTITAMDVIMTGVDDGAAVKEGGYSVGDRGETVDDQAAHRPLNVWQTDGRPMSGDIGKGATTACVRLAEKVLATEALPFGEGQHFVQLAGGTNDRTAPKLREVGLLPNEDTHAEGQQGERRQGQDQPGGFRIGVGGVAYGGHARKTVGLALDRLPGDEGAGGRVEDHPDVLSAALEEAFLLVAGLKPR